MINLLLITTLIGDIILIYLIIKLIAEVKDIKNLINHKNKNLFE